MNNNIFSHFAKSRLLSFSLIYNTNNNLALWTLKTNNLMFNNIKFKSFIHSSSIIKSDHPNPISDSTNPQPTILDPSINSGTSSIDLSNIELVETARIERESKLQVEKYNPKSKEDELENWNNDTPTIDIPLELQVQFGLRIDHTHPISMFDGVEIVSKYLELKHNIAPETISESKLTEIWQIFEKGTVTAEDLFEHMNNQFEKNKEFYIDKLKTETINLSEKISENSINKDSKPFGQYGEVTLNELGQNLKENLKHLNDIRWDLVYDNTKFTVHALPAVGGVFSYSLILKTYLNRVHNRPFDITLSKSEINYQRIVRNKQLAFFFVIGAPLVMSMLRVTAVSFKDIFDLTIGGYSQAANTNSNTVNSIIFLSSLNKKIPSWLKISFKILFVTIIILKLFGFSIGSAFLSVLSINAYYIKVAYYTIFSLRILYNLLILYLLHRFSNQSIKILDVLPEFLIQRLKDIEMMSKTKAGIKEFKTTLYLDISVYLILMCIVIIITYLF